MKSFNQASSKLTSLPTSKQKKHLSIINQQVSDDQSFNLINKNSFSTFDIKQPISLQLKTTNQTNGLNSFMNFLNSSQNSPNKKIKQHFNQKIQLIDQQNPQNLKQVIQRPKSSNNQDGLNKFIDFLQNNDQSKKQKNKKKGKQKINGLNKFMQTLNITQTIKQQKKFTNIVSSILALSQNLPQRSKSSINQKYPYLINDKKFDTILPKNKPLKFKLRCRSATLLSKLIKQKQNVKNIKQGENKKTIKSEHLKSQQNIKALERKLKFFENINSNDVIRLKLSKNMKSIKSAQLKVN